MIKTLLMHQGHKLSLEVWAAGLDERDPENKQYKFGLQVYQIPMSEMLRFNAQFIHDLFGSDINLDKITETVSQMIQDHIEPFLSARVPQELLEKWTTDTIRKGEK